MLATSEPITYSSKYNEPKHILVNWNNSLNKSIWGWFPLLTTMIYGEVVGWGRYHRLIERLSTFALPQAGPTICRQLSKGSAEMLLPAPREAAVWFIWKTTTAIKYLGSDKGNMVIYGKYMGNMVSCGKYHLVNVGITGWWLSHCSEKYEFVSWVDDSPSQYGKKNHVPNHQPDYVTHSVCP